MKSVFPSSSGVSINFPTVSLLSSSPIGNLEALEESSRSSVEVHISNSFEKGLRMEILSVNVILNVGFLMEFIHIEIFDSNTYIILN